MKNTFSILFYPRGNDVDTSGEAPIYARITVNGKRSEFSIKRKVTITKWNAAAGKMKGTTIKVRELNTYMDKIRYRIIQIQENLLAQNKPITANLIKNIFLGKAEKEKMLLEIFQDHNDKISQLVGKDFAQVL